MNKIDSLALLGAFIGALCNSAQAAVAFSLIGILAHMVLG